MGDNNLMINNYLQPFVTINNDLQPFTTIQVWDWKTLQSKTKQQVTGYC